MTPIPPTAAISLTSLPVTLALPRFAAALMSLSTLVPKGLAVAGPSAWKALLAGIHKALHCPQDFAGPSPAQ